MFRARALLCLVAAALLMSASGVYASPSDLWTLDCTWSGDNVTIALSISNPDDLFAAGGLVTQTWGDPTEQDPSRFIPLGDTGAVLRWLTVEADADPMVKIVYSVQANPGPNNTNFTIPSPLVSFDPIMATGTASAGITVTDTNGNGVTATGLLSGGKVHEADYNLVGADKTSFGVLIDGPVTAPAYGSNTVSEAKPWTYIGSVFNIHSQFQFSLTPEDIAGVTSVFVVEPVPEPGSLVAMMSGLIGLTGFVRRRRRA